MGDLAYEQGILASARALFEEGLAIRRELGDRRGIAFSLAGLAAVIAALGNWLRAARVWGAAAQLREEIGSPMPPNEQSRYERRVAQARAGHDAATFDRAWQEGHDARTIHRARIGEDSRAVMTKTPVLEPRRMCVSITRAW
jgi:hypothetical protein